MTGSSVSGLPAAVTGPVEAPAVVVLHGLFGQARNWSGIAKRLSDRYRVHALDLRNHGDGPWREPMAYPEMAADVSDYINAHGLDGCTLVGHSMGGKAAMLCALSAPDHIGRLAVVDIAPAAYRMGFDAYSQAMLAVDLGAVTRRSEVDEALKDVVPQPGVRAFMLQNLAQEKSADGAGLVFRWRCNLPVIHDAMPTLGAFPEVSGRYEGPVLFISGANSDYVRPDHREAIGALFPNAKARVVQGAGHWVHSEQPDGFLRALEGFLPPV